MFLRATKRTIDSKTHLYWSRVENVRNWGEVWLGMELSFKDELFFFLRDRWVGLFGSTCDVVLFDLTSTCFKVDRIEAHIFTAFMALCLLQTLRSIAKEHAPGLTPRQIIEKFRTVKMVNVAMPTTDGRVVTLPRYVEPKKGCRNSH